MHADTSCLHNLLKVWKQLFYEKELSESIDERYLLLNDNEITDEDVK
jgi:hypothetical protein